MECPKNTPLRLSKPAYRKLCKKVFENYEGCCIFCGTPFDLTPCHLIRRTQGGEDTEENLAPGCIPCHTAFDKYEIELPPEIIDNMSPEFYEKYKKQRPSLK